MFEDYADRCARGGSGLGEPTTTRTGRGLHCEFHQGAWRAATRLDDVEAGLIICEAFRVGNHVSCLFRAAWCVMVVWNGQPSAPLMYSKSKGWGYRWSCMALRHSNHSLKRNFFKSGPADGVEC